MCRLAQLSGRPESLASNPCIGWCTTRQFGDDRCKGCGRLESEVSEWHCYTDIEKKLINIRNAADGYPIRQCVPVGWRPTPKKIERVKII